MAVAKRKIDPFTTRSGWTAERRRAQAARLRRSRPWLRSTGPRSAQGKAVSSRNALVHGNRSAAMARVISGLQAQRRFMQVMMADTRARRHYRLSGNDPAQRPPDFGPLLCELHRRTMRDLCGGLRELFPDEVHYMYDPA